MADLGTIKIGVAVDTSKAEKSLGSLGKTVESTENKSGGLAKGLKGLGPAAAGGIAAGGALVVASALADLGKEAVRVGAAVGKQAVSDFRDFEKTLTTAASKTNDFEKALEQFEEAATQAGAESAFSSREAADGLDQLAASGFSVQEATQALPDVLNLATAGSLSMAEATDTATSVMQGFGLQVSDLAEVNDILAATASNASTDIGQLQQGMANTAPVANGLGISLSETSAFMGALADAGIKGSKAGTGLNNIMTRLVNVSGQLGAGLTSADVETLGLAGSLDVLQQSGLSSENAINLFGREAGPALQALLSRGTASVAEFEEQLRNSGGTAQQMADRQLDTLSGAVQVLQGTFDTLSQTLGKRLAPTVKDVVGEVQTFGEALLTLTNESDEVHGGMQGLKTTLDEFNEALKASNLSAQDLAGDGLFLIGGAFQQVAEDSTAVIEKINAVTNLFRSAGEEAQGVIGAVNGIAGGIKNVSRAGLAIPGLQPVSLGVTALASKIEDVTENASEMKDEFELEEERKEWNGVRDSIQGALKALTGYQSAQQRLLGGIGSAVAGSFEMPEFDSGPSPSGSGSGSGGAEDTTPESTMAQQKETEIAEVEYQLLGDISAERQRQLELQRASLRFQQAILQANEDGISAEQRRTQIQQAQNELERERQAIADRHTEEGTSYDPALDQQRLALANARRDVLLEEDELEAARLERDAIRLENELRLAEIKERGLETEAEAAALQQARNEGLAQEQKIAQRISEIEDKRKDQEATINDHLSTGLDIIGKMQSGLSSVAESGSDAQTAINGIGGALQSAIGGVQSLIVAQEAFNASTNANPYMAIASGVLRLGGAISSLVKMSKDLGEEDDDAMDPEEQNEDMARKFAEAFADEQERRLGRPVQVNVDARGALVGEENEIARKLTDMVEEESNNRVRRTGSD